MIVCYLQIAVSEKIIPDLLKNGERRLKFEIFRFLLLNGSPTYMAPTLLLKFDVGLAHVSRLFNYNLIINTVW